MEKVYSVLYDVQKKTKLRAAFPSVFYGILTGFYDQISLGNTELKRANQILLIQAFLRPLIYLHVDYISMRKRVNSIYQHGISMEPFLHRTFYGTGTPRTCFAKYLTRKILLGKSIKRING